MNSIINLIMADGVELFFPDGIELYKKAYLVENEETYIIDKYNFETPENNFIEIENSEIIIIKYKNKL